MYAGSSPRKAIHDIIHNIRQIASNISKDVSTHPQTFTPQPAQDQYPPQRPQPTTYLQETIEIRNATSTRATVNAEESEQAAQNNNVLAQGIKNAHTKIDQALRFVNDMKNKLEPERTCFSVNVLTDGNKEDMAIKNAQLGYPKSLPTLSNPQETPSLGTLPMTFDELGSSPKNGGSMYFGQHDTSRFNPFSKPGTTNMAEMLNLLEQKSVSSATTNQYYTTGSTALNFNSSRSNGQLMQSQIGSVPRRIHGAPVIVSNMIPNTKVINVAPISRPISSSGCDYNRLNQIVHGIKQRGASQQQLSLNDMQIGSVHSLTSLHEQAAAEYEMMRPNTVSHLSKPQATSKGFAFPREINNNFYQLPQAQYEVVPSHFSSQSSLYGAVAHRPNTATSGFLEAVQKATNQLSEGEPSARFSDYQKQEEDEEFCRPRRLKFEKERVERPVYHTRKNTANTHEEKRVKQKRVEVVQKPRRVNKNPTYQHKPHKVKEQPEVYEKKNYREVVHDDDCDSLVDDSVVVVCHARKQREREPSCQHESCASVQSDEDSMEESVRYEIPRGKTVTQRTVETKRSVCANCHCKKTAKQYVVYNTNTCSGRVSRGKEPVSRRQKSSVDDHRVVFDESMNTCETAESYENKGNTLRRNKSIDCNRVRDSMGRKTHAVQRVVNNNNENVPTNETWTVSKSQKEGQNGKISFESLRKKDENQGDYVRYNEKKMSLVRSGVKETQEPLYSKVFVDQLALEFPAAKENNYGFTNSKVVVQKTEVVRSGSKGLRRVPY